MSEFRDRDGNLFRIKTNKYTKEEIEPVDHEFRQREGLAPIGHVESWAYVVRLYSSDGGGVRHKCTDKFIFDNENKALNKIYDLGYTKYISATTYGRSNPKDGWEASEQAIISCEKVKLRV